ncbi:MAG: DUF177 domain-containing protein [Myxococcota bacterium]|nr:DUF177 domain-containing protein [Myxococcota bacterium]
MKILVDRLQDSPSELDFQAGDDWWAEAREVVPELAGGDEDRLRVSVRAHRMGQDVYLEGQLETVLELGCARCLARYREPLREAFRMVLEPAGARVPPEPEMARALARRGVCLGEELEVGWFRGAEIDLSDFLVEQVALAVPVQPLCRETCRGLCPRCGVDRNVESCECETASGASPFAVLESLRRSNGGES